MSRTPRATRWLVPLVLLIVWLAVGGTLGPYAGRLGEVATNDQAAFLPRNAESTRVIEARRAFKEDETLPAIVVWTADGNGTLNAAQQPGHPRAGRSEGHARSGRSGVACDSLTR